MKKCPKCSRVYADDALNFCLDDGEWLTGSSISFDQPTAILSGDPPLSENATQRHVVDTGTISAVLPRTPRSRAMLLSVVVFGAVVLVGLLFCVYRFAASRPETTQTKPSGSLRM